jgi:FkbM family methyltransferase
MDGAVGADVALLRSGHGVRQARVRFAVSKLQATLTRAVDSARYRSRLARGISARGFYARRLRPGQLAFDIGANLGVHAAAMLKAGARVVAVEPQTDLASRLAREHPAVTVLARAVANEPGEATLLTSSDHPELATFDPSWAAMHEGYAQWDCEQPTRVTTIDELIAEFGIPHFLKIDTEGFDDKVLAGLSQPIEQIMFEVQPKLPDVAAGSFERVASLGSYEYRVAWRESWMFGPLEAPSTILAAMPTHGDVYARRLHC